MMPHSNPSGNTALVAAGPSSAAPDHTDPADWAAAWAEFAEELGPRGGLAREQYEHGLWLSEYERLGLCVIPLHPVVWGEDGTPRCGCGKRACPSSPGKHPRISWKNIEKPLPPEQVDRWLHRGPGLPNWGLVMGACRTELCAIDVDPRNGGDKSLARLLADHGTLPHTWRDLSSSGGGHWYFRRPAGLPETSCVPLGDGIEFLQTRHLVNIPPSIHKSGSAYQWLAAPGTTTLADLPQWVADRVQAHERAKGTARGAGNVPVPYFPPMDLSQAEIVRRARTYIDKMESSVQGQRGSNTLMAVAGKLIQGFGLSRQEAWPIICEYNQRAQPPWSEGELRHKLEDAERKPDPKGRSRGYLLANDGGSRRDRLDDGLTDTESARLRQLVRKSIHDFAEAGLDEPSAAARGHDPGCACAVTHLPQTQPVATPPADPRTNRRPLPDLSLADLPTSGQIADLLGERSVADIEATPRGDTWAAARAAGPGIYLDRQAPPYAPQVVQRAILASGAPYSLTVLRSRADCDATADALGSGAGSGLDVAAYPTRDPDNCDNIEEAQVADQIGLPATSAVCPSCMWRKQCGYLPALNRAEKVPHRVMTSARAAATRDIGAAEAVFLLDGGRDVLAPQAETPVLRPKLFQPLDNAAQQAQQRARREQRGKDAAWWHDLVAYLARIVQALEHGEPRSIELHPPRGARPKGWTSTLWSLLREGGRTPRVPRNLIRILTAAASGNLKSLLLVPDDTVPDRHAGPDDRGPSMLGLRLSAVWKTDAPAVPTIVVDSMAAEVLGQLTGTNVVDITQAAPPSWMDQGVQIPKRWTACRRPQAISHAIRCHLADHPNEHLAVLVPGKAAKVDRCVLALLSEAECGLVSMTGWFDAAPVPLADRVLALGVPALPPPAIRKWLAQTGEDEAALVDGDWGSLRWEGESTKDGEMVTVDCWGYRHPAWQRAYQVAVLDLLNRRLAAVRVPVTVVSDLPLGLPLAEGEEATGLSDDERKVIEALKLELTARLTPRLLYIVMESSSKPGVNLAVSLSAIARRANLSTRPVRHLLPRLAQAGWVRRVGRRGGWTLPPSEVRTLVESLPPVLARGAEELPEVPPVAQKLLGHIRQAGRPLGTAELAKLCGLPARTARWHLNRLLASKNVARVGQRGGWCLPVVVEASVPSHLAMPIAPVSVSQAEEERLPPASVLVPLMRQIIADAIASDPEASAPATILADPEPELEVAPIGAWYSPRTPCVRRDAEGRYRLALVREDEHVARWSLEYFESTAVAEVAYRMGRYTWGDTEPLPLPPPAAEALETFSAA